MKLEFDKTLVLPWSNELSKEEPYEYPFLSTYKKGEKILYYVAALHSPNEDSETFQLISSLLETKKIDLVIVEGISNSLGNSPKGLINWANRQGENGSYDGFETAYTIKKTSSLRIPFTGGEPNESYLYDELLGQGFKCSDYLFYNFTQQVFQAQEANTLDTSKVNEFFEEFISKKVTDLNISKTFHFNEYKKWYQQNNNTEFSAQNISPEVCAPYKDGELLTQRISSAMCILRDQFTVSVIETSLNKYKNVMIVYGGSHWSTQKQALSMTLDNPIFLNT